MFNVSRHTNYASYLKLVYAIVKRNYFSCLRLRVDLGDMLRRDFCFHRVQQLLSGSTSFEYNVLCCAQVWNVSFIADRRDSYLPNRAA
jgi:hypothetical protein